MPRGLKSPDANNLICCKKQSRSNDSGKPNDQDVIYTYHLENIIFGFLSIKGKSAYPGTGTHSCVPYETI